MSSKVIDNMETIKLDVPEGSPDGNDASAEQKISPSNRNKLFIGLAILMVIGLVVGITVPLATKNNNDMKDDEAKVQRLENEATPHQCFEPRAGDDCTTEESYRQCQDLVVSGCKMIRSTFSCPPIHVCGDPFPNPEEESTQCPPLIEDDDCATAESHKECLKLERAGCKLIIATASCPPIYACADEPSSEEVTTTMINEVDPPVVACQMDVRPCADGSFVSRTGPDCSFPECPAPVACTMEVKTCNDGITTVGRSGSNCEFELCPEELEAKESEVEEPALVACPMDIRHCPDGSEIVREGPTCQFPQCPPPVACTLEVRPCADGSSVGRTGPNCEFELCPEELEAKEAEVEELALVACPMDIHHCPDGTEIVREGPNCQFPQCPPPVACTLEVRPCADGSSVGRSGPNCEFELCPEELEAKESEVEEPALVACPMDIRHCPDGSEIVRKGPNCQFPQCPPPVACTLEVRPCADGSSVGRSGPNCEFELCPEELEAKEAEVEEPVLVACTLDVQPCADGSFVGRSGPKCEFELCPEEKEEDTNVTEDGPVFGCQRDVRACTGGSFVVRTGPNCEFELCPEEIEATSRSGLRSPENYFP